MLLFKARFRAAIRSGEKRTTLRSWRRALVRPGQVVPTNLGMSLRIEAVEHIALAALTDAHAQADGFPDRQSLLAELQRIYHALPPTLTLVRFTVVA